jgi:glycosyltransferase involved in cell wall biosynthesis
MICGPRDDATTIGGSAGMIIKNRMLFNFAASYSGGGLKRLYEYSRCFNGNGGAHFIIHSKCENLMREFANNRFFMVKQSTVDRVLNDCGYLGSVVGQIGKPDLYYSYGIPVYRRIGLVNWFHLSNVLPLNHRDIPVSPLDFVRLEYLGRRIIRNLPNADVISAESNYSLGLIDGNRYRNLFVSVNGSDDELEHLGQATAEVREKVATVVGTGTHKGMEETLRVFDSLREKMGGLRLSVIGDPRYVPKKAALDGNVTIHGVLPRSEVIRRLRSSEFYISTTLIENSYNAASEGAFLANESYVSDIGPHRELFANTQFDQVSIPGVNRPLLHVRRSALKGAHLKTWDTVIMEMLCKFRTMLGRP